MSWRSGWPFSFTSAWRARSIFIASTTSKSRATTRSRPAPFTVKRIEINPDALKPNQDNPISKLPVPEPPKNPAAFTSIPTCRESAAGAPAQAQRTLGARSQPGHRRDRPEREPALHRIELGADHRRHHQVPVDRVERPAHSSKLAQDVINAGPGFPTPRHRARRPGAGPRRGGRVARLRLARAELPRGRADRLPICPTRCCCGCRAMCCSISTRRCSSPRPDPLLGQAIGLITKYPSAAVQIDGLQRFVRQARLQPDPLTAARAGGRAWLRPTRGPAGRVSIPVAGTRQRRLCRAAARLDRSAAAQPARGDFDPGAEAVNIRHPELVDGPRRISLLNRAD